jgi:hypothetical protein
MACLIPREKIKESEMTELVEQLRQRAENRNTKNGHTHRSGAAREVDRTMVAAADEIDRLTNRLETVEALSADMVVLLEKLQVTMSGEAFYEVASLVKRYYLYLNEQERTGSATFSTRRMAGAADPAES